MTGLPTITVKLDDGTGAYPYDVTTSARLPETIAWSRGRSDEHSANQPGVVALAFDNTDGAFSLGNATNLQSNPSLEAAFVSGGGTLGAATDWAFDATAALSGTRGIKVTIPIGAVGQLGFNNERVAAVPGQVFSCAIWVKRVAGAGNLRFQIEWLDAGFAHIGASAFTDLSVAAAPIGTWVRATVVNQTAPASTAFLRFQVSYSSYVAGTDIASFDLVQTELGSVATFEVFNDQGIQLSVNGNVRWTGRVQNWPVSWPDGDDTFSVVLATATDILAGLSRQVLRSALGQETLADAPTVFYPFDESEGATQAAEVANAGASLVSTSGFVLGAMPAFGTDLGLPDGSSGAKFAAGNVTLASSPALVSGSTLRLTLVFNSSAGTNALTLCQILKTAGGFNSLVVQSTGVGGFMSLVGVTVSVGANLHDGKPHVVTVQVDAGAADIWLDGVKTSTAGVVSGWFYDTLTVPPGAGGLTGGETVVVADLSSGPKISDARVAAVHLAAMTDLAGETPAQRITRVAGYAAAALGSIDTAGSTLCGAASQAGRNVLDVFNETAAAALGDLYADNNGRVAFVAGATLVARNTPATFDANWIDETTQILVDMFGVINDATAQRSGASNKFAGFDQGSIAAHGRYREDLTWNVSTDQQVLDRLTWTIATYANPQPRVAQLVLDLETMDAPTLAAALALDLTSFLRATGMPAQTPGGTVLDVIVESITETVTASDSGSAWTLTFNVSMKARSSAWILGDATYGVLGTTTKLYV